MWKKNQSARVILGIWAAGGLALGVVTGMVLLQRQKEHRTPPPVVEVPRSQETEEGYVYGMRGSTLARAAVISSLDIVSDGMGGQRAAVIVRKGPDYASNDPDLYGYPGCTLLTALTGGYFEDMDSAQVIICWRDARGGWHTSDNLVAGPTLGRKTAATWEWLDNDGTQEAVCVRVAIGGDATEFTVLLIYTDVLYVYNDSLPEDGPAVIGSWDAQRGGDGRWRITRRDELGVGAMPEMDAAAREKAANDVQKLIEMRSNGRYTMQWRYNIGQPNPFVAGRVIAYDSGFDIVPVSDAATVPPR